MNEEKKIEGDNNIKENKNEGKIIEDNNIEENKEQKIIGNDLYFLWRSIKR